MTSGRGKSVDVGNADLRDSDDHFVARYVGAADEARATAPTLSDSLRVFSAMPALAQAVAFAPAECRCLIQGYTAPRNAESLRGFLRARGIPDPHVTAVDLLDLPSIYGRLGLDIPQMEFIQADASDLAGLLGDGTFDVVVQDFVLNCAPAVQAERLLNEARRVLKRSGSS